MAVVRSIKIAVLCGVLAATGLSCREREPDKKTAPPAAPKQPQPTVMVPTTTSVALPAVIWADFGEPGHTQRTRFDFPPAKLALVERQGVLHATLYSDDPPEALQAGYLGNMFYFEMELDVPTKADLADATWNYVAPSNSDLGDTHNGFFLQGGGRELQPQKVTIQFDTDNGLTVAKLSGEFADLGDAGTTRPTVFVTARWVPTVLAK